MINKYLIIIIGVLSIVMVGSFKKTTSFYSKPKKETNLVLYDREKDTKDTLELENYIVGVVSAEMPASFNEEALKAQAVAARTYALYMIKHSNKDYDLISDITNQGYYDINDMKNKWGKDYEYYYNKIKKVVNDTKGEFLSYNDEVIIAYYFAMSNGKTENVQNVFKEEKNYLKSVDSSWDKNVHNFEVTNNYSYEEFKSKLNINNIKIGDIKRNSTGRVEYIVIDNKRFKVTEIRKLLDLRSTDFDIELKDRVYVTTRGYGHGVGLSQWGANEMAKMGHNYKEILAYYYQNTKIKNINV